MYLTICTAHLKRVVPIFLLFISQVSFAQKNYQPGYVILSSGDTLTGLLDYRNWKNNPNKISFRIGASDTEKEYTPAEISSFGVADEVYVAATVQTENSPYRINDLSYSSATVLSSTTTFLQTVIGGTKGLFYYMDERGKDQLYIKQGSTFDLLIHKKYFVNRTGGQSIAENQRYLGQLTVYLQECSRIQNKIGQVKYGKASVERLFRLYYDCMGSEADFQKETERLSVAFGILAGATASSLSFESNSYDYLTRIDYPQSFNASAGVFLNLLFPRNFQKLSFYNELLYTSYRTEGGYEDFENSDLYSVSRVEMAYAYIKLNTMMRYAHPLGNGRIFLNGGISSGFAVSETNRRTTERHAYGNTQVREENALKDARRYEQGYLMGLGGQLGRYSVEARYERANGMSLYRTLGSSVRRYHLLVGYRF